MDPVYEAAVDPGVREIILVTPSQSSKTETLLNIIGHRFDEGPRVPALVIQPTSKLAKSFADERLRNLIRSTKTLWEKLEKGQRDRITEKFLAGVPLRVGWAGSPTELASHPIGLAVVDERDRMDANVGGEGDPVGLVRARGKNFPSFLMVVTSTPTTWDLSAIQALFDNGSREMWEWQHGCGHWFRPMLKHLNYPKNSTPDEAAANATLRCPQCDEAIPSNATDDLNKNARMRQYMRDDDGEYVPDPNPPPKGPTRSFWVTGPCTPWTSFEAIARELAAADRDGTPEVMQTVVNTYGGELYRISGDSPDWERVLTLRRDYKRGTVPSKVKVLTLGADVQKHGIWFVVRGWGFNMSSWLIDDGFIAGETEFDDVWIMLSQVLQGIYDGYPIKRAFIDSGYTPGRDRFRRPDSQIYLFCRRHMGHAYPSKGYATRPKPIQSSQIDVTHGGMVIKNGLTLWILDSDHCKSWVYSRIDWPDNAENGHWLVHDEVDEDYCRQVTAEEFISKPTGQRVWLSQRSKPNHLLDAESICYAAAKSIHVETLQEDAPTPTTPLPPPPPRQPSRFGRRSL